MRERKKRGEKIEIKHVSSSHTLKLVISIELLNLKKKICPRKMKSTFFVDIFFFSLKLLLTLILKTNKQT